MTGSAPQPSAVPIAPPAPLMPGANTTLQSTAGSGLKQTEGNLQSIASGQNLQSIFQAITAAQASQDKYADAAIKNSMGAAGLGMSSDLMKQIAQYQLQSNQNTQAELGKLSIEQEGVQLGASQAQSELFGNAAMAYAPTQVVAGGGTAGPSPFAQATSAATGAVAAIAALMMALP